MDDAKSAVHANVPYLEVEDVVKHFPLRGRRRGFVRAVDGVSFSLRPGETLAIVGESGSGKSTLVRTILRLIEPTSGVARLDGQNLFALGARQMRSMRRHVQMIFQDPYASLHPRRTVAEAIAEPWRVHAGVVAPGEQHERIKELLVQVGLSPAYARAYPSRLSGGERQRVAIARALAMRPEVLILDEPVSALDVSIQAQVIRLLMRLQHEMGMAYIFISHDLPLVRLVADRVAVMYMGRFVETGVSGKVYGSPRHPYTRLLLGSTPDAMSSRDENNEPRTGTAVEPVLMSGCRFRPRCPQARQKCAEVEPALAGAPMDSHAWACHFPAGDDEVLR